MMHQKWEQFIVPNLSFLHDLFRISSRFKSAIYVDFKHHGSFHTFLKLYYCINIELKSVSSAPIKGMVGLKTDRFLSSKMLLQE